GRSASGEGRLRPRPRARAARQSRRRGSSTALGAGSPTALGRGLDRHRPAARRRRQADYDRRALAGAAVDGTPAPMQIDDVANDAQADTRAADLRVDGSASAEKRLEDVRQIGSVDTEAAIRDGDANAIAVGVDGNVHGPAAAAVLDGVADDVLDRRSQRL